MNGHPKPMTERLYLHKDETDEIYVDNLLHQHHIDGIRFLFKQFKKKVPGVIINNPLGYGNSMLVALFLGAIQHLLEKPILILCEESEELNWLEHFQKLTQCYNVGIAAESPFVKKSIFINTMQRLEQFCRRDWAVLVVDNDTFLKEKTLQTKFSAEFKIWVTPVDMKDNLQTFASIFKWLYPREKLNLDEYKAKSGDVKDAVARSILLDTLFQDIVCRTHLLTPFETPYPKAEGTPKKTSKKNKDATGTKIKRSKRLSDSPGTSNGGQERSDMDSGVSAVKIPKLDVPQPDAGDFSIRNFRINQATDKCDVVDSNNSEMDVESFIRNEEPKRFDPFEDFMQDYDNVSHNSEESRTDLMEEEPIIYNNTPEKLNTLIDMSGAADIEDIQECFEDSDTNSESLMPAAKDNSSRSSADEYDLDTKQIVPEFVTDNVLNEIKDEMSDSHNSETNNDTKSDETLKTEQDKNVEESPKKDLNSKIMNLDEQISKKFQGSLLDRLF